MNPPYGSSEWYRRILKDLNESECKVCGILHTEDPTLDPLIEECILPALKHIEEAERLIAVYAKLEYESRFFDKRKE